MSTLEQIKVKAAVEATVNAGFNQVKAAKALGISRGTLRSLLSQYTGGSLNKSGLVAKYLKESASSSFSSPESSL